LSEDTFADYAAATRTRDAVAKIAQEAVGTPQPLGMLGRLISLSVAQRKARVWLPGDDAPIEVNLFPSVIPYISQDSLGMTEASTTSTTGGGARVWVERINDKLFVTEVLSGPVFTEASGGFEHYLDAVGAEAGVAGKPWYTRTGASTSVIVPLPQQGQTVTFGPFGGSLGEGFTEITVSDQVFGSSKTYMFSGLAAQALLSTPGYYQKLIPRFINHSEDVEVNKGNFELEIGNEQIVPDNTTVPGTYLMLRLRRRADNQASIAQIADGYHVTIRSNGGMTQAAHESGHVPFRWFTGITTLPSDTYGTTVFTTQMSEPNSGPYDSPFVHFPTRAQFSICGGDNIRWEGSNFSFGSFKVMFSGRHIHTFNLGEQYITMPPQGTVIVEVGDVDIASKTVGTDGIQLLPGEGLYYALDPGVASSVSDASRFRIVNSEKSIGIPPFWLFLAGATGAVPSLKLGTGEQYDHRRGATFAGTWQNVGGEYSTMQYFMGPSRMVTVEGSMRTSGGGAVAGDTAFTLPAGFRPQGRLIVAGVASTGTANTPAAARIDVLASGAVAVYAPSTTGVSLNFQFRAYQ